MQTFLQSKAKGQTGLILRKGHNNFQPVCWPQFRQIPVLYTTYIKDNLLIAILDDSHQRALEGPSRYGQPLESPRGPPRYGQPLEPPPPPPIRSAPICQRRESNLSIILFSLIGGISLSASFYIPRIVFCAQAEQFQASCRARARQQRTELRQCPRNIGSKLWAPALRFTGRGGGGGALWLRLEDHTRQRALDPLPRYKSLKITFSPSTVSGEF